MNLSKQRISKCMEGIGLAIFILMFTLISLYFLYYINASFWRITASDGGGPGAMIAAIVFMIILFPIILGTYIFKFFSLYKKWFQQKIGFCSFEGKCILILLGFFSISIFFYGFYGFVNAHKYDLHLFMPALFIIGVIYLLYWIPRFINPKSRKITFFQLLLSLFFVLLFMGFLLGNSPSKSNVIYISAALVIGYISIANKSDNFDKKLLLAMYLLLPLIWFIVSLELNDYPNEIDLKIFGIKILAWFIGLIFLIFFLKIKNFWKIVMIGIFVVLTDVGSIAFYEVGRDFGETLAYFLFLILPLIIFTFMSIWGLIEEEVKNK